jgi:hypothetical protein
MANDVIDPIPADLASVTMKNPVMIKIAPRAIPLKDFRLNPNVFSIARRPIVSANDNAMATAWPGLPGNLLLNANFEIPRKRLKKMMPSMTVAYVS